MTVDPGQDNVGVPRVRRDRYGDEIEPESDGHRCDHGFVDRDADTPRPCLVCKPWLSRSARDRRAYLDRPENGADR